MRMVAKWGSVAAAGVLVATLGGCGGGVSTHSGTKGTSPPSTVAPTTYTTPDGTPQLDGVAKLACQTIFQMAASASPLTLPDATGAFDGTKHEALGQSLKVWNENPGATFNLGQVQAACSRLGLWPGS